MKLFIFVSMLVFLISWTSDSPGVVLTVKADGSGNYLDIKSAIMAAAPGDSVCLVDSLYTGPNNRNLSFLGKPITVYSQAGDPDSCLIDCGWDFNGPPYPDLLGFLFTAGEDSNSVLAGIKIFNGGLVGAGGGGILCENSSPRIENCKVMGFYGCPGLYCYNSSPIVSSTAFSENWNSPNGAGGIILSFNSSPRLIDCKIENNLGKDCIDKSSECLGGGILCEGNSNPLLVGCRISGNSTNAASGAGMACYDSSPVIVDCVFSFNAIFLAVPTVVYGGGLDCYNSSPILEGCIFYGNGSDTPLGGPSSGGAVSFRAGSVPHLENCTIAGNLSGTDSGGIYLSDSSLTAGNTIIAFNSNDAIYADSPGIITLSCCNIYGNPGGDWNGAIAGQLGINGNISLDPQFCDSVSRDFTLQADSPCALENNTTCGQIGALPVGCRDADEIAIGDIQYYDPITGSPDSPYVNQSVKAVGVVYAVKGTLTDYGFYFQDETGGINYFAPHASGVAVGDTIRVSAAVYSYGGEIYLHDTSAVPDLEILGTGPEPDPRDFTVGDLVSDFENVGWFVRTSGIISNLGANGFTLNDDGNVLTVYVSNISEIDLNSLRNGSPVTVQGACVVREGEIQVWPRCQADIAGGVGPLTLYVSPSGSDSTGDGTAANPFGTIQYAINISHPGDEVCLQPGTYSGEGNRNMSFMGKAITVFSASGNPQSCVIDCGFDSGNLIGELLGFFFISGEDSSSVLMDVTISNGISSSNNGLITCNNSSPKISNCIITTCEDGPGISCINSSPIISSTTVSLSGMASHLGGVYIADNSSPALSDCTVSNNYGPDCFEKNTVCSGGGVVCEGNSSPVFVRCYFWGNSNLSASGAGLGCDSSSPTLIDCVFFENSTVNVGFSEVFGSALDCYNSTVVLEGCLFYGNNNSSAKDFETTGGALSIRGNSNVQVRNCTIAGNISHDPYYGGGGIYLSESSLVLANSIIAFNDEEAVNADSLSSVSLECCNIFGNSEGDWIGPISGQLGMNGNISDDPQFCGSADDTNPYSLNISSPCSEQANPSCGLVGAYGVNCDLVSVVEDGGRKIPFMSRLHANSPNPFNPQTTIRFDLNRSGHVDLVIFDMGGHMVKRLVSGFMVPGRNSVVWDGRDDAGRHVASGVYFYRLEAGDYSETKRMVLVK